MTPCVGRRKRDADFTMAPYNYDNEVFMDHNANDLGIDPTASIALIVDSTTLTDPLVVSEYLVAHQPSSQSIIYPSDVTISDIDAMEQSPASSNVPSMTELYPSNDSPDQTTFQDDIPDPTTETPVVMFDAVEDVEQETTPNPVDDMDVDKARVGLGRTTTVTTVIRVTSVATTLASGTAATLSISYMGCLPPSLPVSGVPC